jgi:hypothetical protein
MQPNNLDSQEPKNPELPQMAPSHQVGDVISPNTQPVSDQPPEHTAPLDPQHPITSSDASSEESFQSSLSPQTSFN